MYVHFDNPQQMKAIGNLLSFYGDNRESRITVSDPNLGQNIPSFEGMLLIKDRGSYVLVAPNGDELHIS